MREDVVRGRRQPEIHEIVFILPGMLALDVPLTQVVTGERSWAVRTLQARRFGLGVDR